MSVRNVSAELQAETVRLLEAIVQHKEHLRAARAALDLAVKRAMVAGVMPKDIERAVGHSAKYRRRFLQELKEEGYTVPKVKRRSGYRKQNPNSKIQFRDAFQRTPLPMKRYQKEKEKRDGNKARECQGDHGQES